jgi:tRNA nucleotidyltransferase/poly(A) polymerase
VPAGGRWAAAHHDEAETDLAVTERLPDGAFDQLLATNPELGVVARAIDVHGAPSYLVGGPVRDLALGEDPKDLDITSPLTPDDFRQAMTGIDGCSVYDVGEAHGTTGVSFKRPDGTEITVEHTTHRTEVYEPGSRVPTVGFGDELGADLDRRDFTLNAVAINLMTGEVTDPHDGLADLAAGVLRCPDDPMRTMGEDPLRGFRAVRFAALRGFTIDDETAAAIAATSDRYGIVSVERRRDELLRVLHSGPVATARAMEVMDGIGVRSRMMGDLGDLTSGPEITAANLARTDVLPALASKSSDPVGALKALKVTNDERDRAMAAVRALDALSTHTDRPALRWEMRRHGAEAMATAARIGQVGYSGRSGFEHARIEQAIAEEAGFATQPLPVDGNDALAAGRKGRDVGEALRTVERAMCEDPGLTREQALLIL